jgi:hypothetical protein
MSCVLPSTASEEIGAPGMPPLALGAELANGLHAMAQPLTILRGALGALTLAKAVAPGSERYLEMSSVQVERLCAMLASLQGLLDTAQLVADSTMFDLAEVIGMVLDDFEPNLQKSGLRMQATRPEQPIFAVGDAGRSEVALHACLQIATAISMPGDTVAVKWQVGDGFAEVTVAHERMRGAELGSSERLSLALAEANLRSQGGFFAYIQDPFESSLRIPLQRPDKENSGASSLCSSVPLLH